MLLFAEVDTHDEARKIGLLIKYVAEVMSVLQSFVCQRDTVKFSRDW